MSIKCDQKDVWNWYFFANQDHLRVIRICLID